MVWESRLFFLMLDCFLQSFGEHSDVETVVRQWRYEHCFLNLLMMMIDSKVLYRRIYYRYFLSSFLSKLTHDSLSESVRLNVLP
jgi:hypothetical protein